MSSIRRNKNGTVTIRAYAGINPATGRQRQISKTLPAEMPQEGIERERSSLDDLAEAMKGNSKTMTIGSAMKVYLRMCVEDGMSPATIEPYESYVRRHVDPMIGSVFFDRATPALFTNMYRDLRKPKPKGAGLADSTVYKIHAMLLGAFKKLKIEKLIPFNPLLEVTTKRGESGSARPLLPDDYIALISWLNATIERASETAIADDESFETLTFATMMWVTLHTGLRRSELVGAQEMHWVCRATRSGIYVKRVVVHDKRASGKVRAKDPKSGASRRFTSTAGKTRDVMKRYLAIKRAMLESKGIAVDEETPLFCHADGSAFKPFQITRRFRSLREELGLQQWVHPHTLRHTHASYLLEREKASLRSIKDRLGHSDISTTGNLYTHTLPEAADELAIAADDISEEMLAEAASSTSAASYVPTCPKDGSPCMRFSIERREDDLQEDRHEDLV